MMRNRRRYAHMSTLEEVRRERMRADRMVRQAQDVIVQRYYDTRDMFSLEGMIDIISDKVMTIQNLAKYMYHGYRYAISMFKGRGRR